MFRAQSSGEKAHLPITYLPPDTTFCGDLPSLQPKIAMKEHDLDLEPQDEGYASSRNKKQGRPAVDPPLYSTTAISR